MASQIQTCFITAPAGSNLDVLTDALRRRNIRVVVPANISPGTEIETELASLMTSVDLVIGVLTRERRSEWVLFELGQAFNQGKRILLFAPPKSAHLPSGLRGFLTVRANLSNRVAVEFALDQLLAVTEARPAPPLSRKETRPLGTASETYQRTRSRQSVKVSDVDLEVLVAGALRDSGVEVITTGAVDDHRVDLAVWSDGLQPSVGNPLVIEIKRGPLSPRQFSEGAQQLASHLAVAGARWGLLLFDEGPGEFRSLPPNVLALSIDTLIRRLERESFDDIVRDMRNRRVHGVAG